MKGPLRRTKMRTEPAREPEVRNADCVIGVKMREEQSVDVADRYADLKQPDGRPAPGIDQNSLIAGFDQRTRAETIGAGNWDPRPEQSDSKMPSLLQTFDIGFG